MSRLLLLFGSREVVCDENSLMPRSVQLAGPPETELKKTVDPTGPTRREITADRARKLHHTVCTCAAGDLTCLDVCE